MTDFKLNAALRPVPTPRLKSLKKAGQIPAELYGQGQPNAHLFLKKTELEKVYRLAGSNSLIDLTIGNQPPVKAMIHDIQYNPLTDYISHVDFYQVNMERQVTVPVPVVLFGESKAVKDLGATLVKSLSEIEIFCLPNDLIHEIKVDISVLENIGQSIKVADLTVPKNIKVLTPKETTVASVITQAVEKEVPAAPVAEAAPAEGEIPAQEPAIAGEETK